VNTLWLVTSQHQVDAAMYYLLCPCNRWPSMFTSTEKAQIQAVFLIWANAAVTGYMHPSPVGMVQDAQQLLPGARGVANNYASAHMRQLAYYALSFDAADDPPVDPTLPQVGPLSQLSCVQTLRQLYTLSHDCCAATAAAAAAAFNAFLAIARSILYCSELHGEHWVVSLTVSGLLHKSV
jgi:hypothetical protein